jgi:S1-C subfamily serine protease
MYPRASQAQDARVLAQRAFRSVVLITTSDAAGQPLALGSGFFVSDSLVVTNAHVVRGAAGANAKLVGAAPHAKVLGVVAVDVNHDLALLVVGGLGGSAMPVSDGVTAEVGARIYAIGNPRGLEGTFSEGIVSGIRAEKADTLVQITAPISPGSSGGPVINSEGQVVGVATSSFTNGQSLNFAVPASYVRRLIAARAALSPLASAVPRAQGGRSSLPPQTQSAITAGDFLWAHDDAYSLGSECLMSGCEFTLSIRNRTTDPVKDVRYLVIFYNARGEPLHVEEGSTSYQVLRPGLALRINGSVDTSVRRLTARWEFRLLDFTPDGTVDFE